ncbi:type VI secretion system baseplate subunit TssG [Defluviimonas sp. WL0024]|uniref:Type VI secretion system baseplate subunit TssG n=1 Tax=Albidovulum salinarum TaxID=2984153 RepID=A0ABT2X7G3_9RHOB|nr:type VI secretion system baseplate subunit TssG [Defluviimonas sp. WL0024]MCU9849885.1 type VI secretion system baseplate subunit TssG [Defluviimonas sp. WL0024]
MATGERARSTDLSLFENLKARPEEHHLFQALRIVEAAFPDAPRLGESLRPREDPVRLGQEAELAFPTSSIARFEAPQPGKPGRLTNRFFGFFGPQGPLPLHLTEFARDRLRNHRDGTFVAFANMLTHRFMSLFYRAWASGQPAPSHDRGDDPVARKVSALAGYRGAALEGRDELPDDVRRYFVAHLASGPKTPEGLVAIITSYLGVPAAIQEFVGSWLDLEPDDTWQLGGPARLGRSTSIGSRVWSRSSKFRLLLGPMPLADYERLLPHGSSMKRLQAIVRTYVGDALEWDVNLVLRGEDVPRASLGGSTRLGHTSWVRMRADTDQTRPDAADLYVYPGAA